MADAFPIVGARQELGFTPTGAVRANIDVRTGEGAVGAAIGQGIVQLTRQALQEKKRRDEHRRRIEEKRRQMQDANSAVTANKLRDTATIEFETFKLTNPQETWEPFRIKQAGDVATQIGGLDFSPDAAETQRLKSEAYTSTETARSLTQATRQLRTDTIAALTESMVDSFRSGDKVRMAESTRTFADNGANMGKDKAEVLSDIKIAKEAGEKLRTEDEINKVHGAIELASTTGDFDIPKELAKNPIIPETKQASLRTAIGTAEKARDANIKDVQTELVNKATSTAVREYFAGQQTVANLNQQHEKGLIKDSEFKFMMKGLQDVIPDNSNPVAAGKIRRANASFSIGAIDRAAADEIVLENYSKLDAEDRENVVADLEDIEAKVIATSKSNAYSEGRGLMSRQFIGIQSPEDFNLFTAGLTDAQKQKLNKRFTLEINNRDLYERAIDDRFKELRKEGVSDVSKYNTEGLRILLEYQKRAKLGLEELEAAVKEEQSEILQGTERGNLLRELERVRQRKRGPNR